MLSMLETSAPSAGSFAKLANRRLVASKAANAMLRGARPSRIAATAGARHCVISDPKCEIAKVLEVLKGEIFIVGEEAAPTKISESPLTPDPIIFPYGKWKTVNMNF